MEEYSRILIFILVTLMVLPTVVTRTISRHFYYNASGVEITSPKFPSTYDFDGNIYEYVIRTFLNEKPYIHLTFSDFQLDVALSTLKIYEGKVNDNPRTSSWTGSRPPVYISSGRFLTLVFKPGTKQAVLSRINYVGFKVRASFHGEEGSRNSPLIGQPELPKLIPAVGFCGYLYTTLPKYSNLALSGHQMSPKGNDTIGGEKLTMECFWSGTVISKVFYLLVKSTPSITYNVHNGRTSEDVTLTPHSETRFTNKKTVTTYRLSNGSFYVMCSGSLEKTDYFAFSFAPTVFEAASLAEGLQKLHGTNLCPFKSCDSRCVWDWSSCHDNGTSLDDSPDCDELGRKMDIKSCYSNQTYDEPIPGRCYRQSLDACDDYVDCRNNQKDEALCPTVAAPPFDLMAGLPAILSMGAFVACFFACVGCWKSICKQSQTRCQCVQDMCDGLGHVCQALSTCGQFLLSKLRDCFRSLPDVFLVEAPAVPPAEPTAPPEPTAPDLRAMDYDYDAGVMAGTVGPPGGRDSGPPSYQQVAPAAGSQLPSYDEAMEEHRVISDRATPPPSYLSAW